MTAFLSALPPNPTDDQAMAITGMGTRPSLTKRVDHPSILRCDAPRSHYTVEPAHLGRVVVPEGASSKRHYVILTVEGYIPPSTAATGCYVPLVLDFDVCNIRAAIGGSLMREEPWRRSPSKGTKAGGRRSA